MKAIAQEEFGSPDIPAAGRGALGVLNLDRGSDQELGCNLLDQHASLFVNPCRWMKS